MSPVIPPPITEAGSYAFRDSTFDIAEDAKAGLRPYNIDVYIAEDNNGDSKYMSSAMSDIHKRRSHMPIE
jgi:hypothetical protein